MRGAVLLFAVAWTQAAFPLAPLLGLLNNYVEVRVDAVKLLDVHRRPDPGGAEDIGMWLTILVIMATAAVVTNGLIVTFTSSKLADFLGTSNRLLLFLLIEHALMLVLLVIKVVVDDVPEDVQLQMDRQDYLVRKIIDHEPYHDDDGTYAEYDAPGAMSRMLTVHESEFNAFAEHNFVQIEDESAAENAGH